LTQNRLFKGNYRAITGFGSKAESITRVTLFTAYFIFLRLNASLEYQVPVIISELEKQPHMPAKLTRLIALAQTYLSEKQQLA